MLRLYRRHLQSCPDRKKGQAYSLCQCPIWCYGELRGAPFRQSLRTDDAALAEARILELESGRGAALMMNLKSPPLVSVVRSYIEECREANSGLRESTVDQYQRVLMAFAGDARGKLPLVAVTQATIERYREGRSVKPGTWRKELQILRTFFKWATNTKEWLDR